MKIVVRLSDAARVIKEYQNAGYIYDGSINQDLTCVTLEFKDLNIPKKDKVTDIEFHEGDFVENNDGRTGYISSICHCDECKKRGFFEPTIKYSDGTEDYISNYSAKTIQYDYKQIGLQKFNEGYFKDKTADLEKQLRREKAKSFYWRMRAKGEDILFIGSKEDIRYLFE